MMSRKRRKLNWKLLMVLAVLTGLAAGVFVWDEVRNSAHALMRKGDVAASEGHFEGAFDWYRRGLHQQPNNLLLLSKCGAMVQAFEPEGLGSALEHTRFMMQCYERILSIDPMNTTAQNALLRLEYEWAESLNDAQLWQGLFDRASDLIASSRIMQSPSNPEARRLLAIAEMRRGSVVDVELAEARVRDYLLGALKEFPQDLELSVLLSNYYSAMGQRMLRTGSALQAGHFFDDAEEVLAPLVSADTSLMPLIMWARVLFAAGRNEEALTVVRALEPRLAAEYEQRTLQFAAEFYRAFETELAAAEPGLGLGVEAILHRLSELHPDALMARMLLAGWFEEHGRLVELETVLRSIWEAQLLVKPGPAALVAASLRPAAGSQLIDFYLSRHAESSDPSVRTEYLLKCREILEVLKLADRKDALLDVLEGKLAFAEGHFSASVERLIEVENRFGIKDPKLLFLMAQGLLQLGDAGAAQDRLSQIVRSGQGTPEVFVGLSDLFMKQRDVFQALKMAEAGFRAFPNDLSLAMNWVRVQLVNERWGGTRLARADMLKRLNGLLEKLPAASAESVFMRAYVLRVQRKFDEARALLTDRLAAAPTDEDAALLLSDVELDVDRRAEAVACLRAVLARVPDSTQVAFRLVVLTDDESVLTELEARVLLRPDLFKEAFELYQYYRSSGEVERSLVILKRVCQLHPQNYRAMDELLKNHIELREWDEAERLVTRARDLNVDRAQGAAFEGQLFLARGAFDRAVFSFQQAVERRPQDSTFWKLLGDACLQSGKQQDAMEAFERAIKLRPDRLDAQWALHRLYHLQGDKKRAADILYQMALQTGDAGIRNTHLNYLARYVDVKQALMVRRRLAKREPDDLINLRALVTGYMQAGDYASARLVLDQLNARPDRALEDVASLAAMIREQGEPEKGLAMLSDFVGALGESAGLEEWLTLARFESSLRHFEEAEYHFQRALGVDRSGEAARAYAGWLKEQKRLDAAVEQLSVVRDESGRTQDWLQLVALLLESGEYEHAEAELDGFLMVHPADTQTFILQGLIAERAGRTEDAAVAFDRSVQLAPSNSNALFQRAWFGLRHLDLRSIEDVIADLKRTVEFRPNMLEALELLAQAESSRPGGDVRAAMSYAKVIELSPSRRGAYLALSKIYLRGKEYWKLRQLLERARAQFVNDPVWFQVEAQMLLQEGRKQDALSALRSRFELSPEPAALQSLVQMLLQLDRNEDALAELDSNAALLEKSGLLMSLHGVVLMRVGRVDEGHDQLVDSIAFLKGHNEDVEATLAVMDNYLDRSKRVAVFEQALNSEFDDRVCVRLAALYVSEGALARADALIADGLARELNNADRVALLLQLSALRVRQDRVADAVMACESVLKLNPNHLLALNNLAYLLSERLGRAEDALLYAEKAVKLGGQDIAVVAGLLDTLGSVHYQLENFELAAFYFNRSLKLVESDEVLKRLESTRKRLLGNG
jgi:tetratricopeptide (TPR) repeat protein